MFWIIIAFVVSMVLIAYWIYSLPSETSSRKKSKKDKAAEKAALIPDPVTAAANKNWEDIAKRWEKNNNALLGDVEKLKQQERKLQKELDEAKAQHKELVEKLSLEKSWREKEQVNLDKVRTHEKDLKEQMMRTEKDLEKEHSSRLRLERELQELKIKHEAVAEEKRVHMTKAASLETTVAQLSKQNKDLQRDNEELKRKREDIQWVAKSEFDELKKKFQQQSTEIERLKGQAG